MVNNRGVKAKYDILESNKPFVMNYFQKSRQKLLHAFIAMLIFAVYIVWQVKRQPVDPPLWITLLGGIAFFYCIGSSFLGFLNGIQSYLRQEPYTYKRAWVMFGNFCFFGIFFLLIIVNIVDAIRFFGR